VIDKRKTSILLSMVAILAVLSGLSISMVPSLIETMLITDFICAFFLYKLLIINLVLPTT
jgi:hypothetical protein